MEATLGHILAMSPEYVSFALWHMQLKAISGSNWEVNSAVCNIANNEKQKEIKLVILCKFCYTGNAAVWYLQLKALFSQ